MSRTPARVLAVSRDPQHGFSKKAAPSIDLVAGEGVAGDAHAGVTVQHRSRVARDPLQPNLRQVHLIDTSFLSFAADHGFDIGPGDLGENITTEHLEPLSLPRGALLRIGADVVLRVTGLRNPCQQINDFRPGLLGVAVERNSTGDVERRVGIMTVVEAGGRVSPGDPIAVVLPEQPHEPLTVV